MEVIVQGQTYILRIKHHLQIRKDKQTKDIGFAALPEEASVRQC